MNTNSYLIKKAFNAYLVTAILAYVSSTLSGTINNVMAGNLLDATHLAALGMITPLVATLSALSFVLSAGSLTLCNIFTGRNQQSRVNPVFTLTLLAGLALAFLLTLILFFAPKQLAGLLGADAALIPYVAEYIRYYSWASFPFIGCYLLMTFARMDGSPKLGLYSVLAMTAATVIFIYLLVARLGMGMDGLALANGLGCTVACLVSMLHFFKKTNTLRLAPLGDVFGDLKQIVILGLPSAMFKIASMICILLLNRLLLREGGVAAVSAFSLYLSVDGMVGSIPLGVGQVVLQIASLFYGEEDRSSLRSTLRLSLTTGLLLSSIAALLTWFSAPYVPALFGVEQADIVAFTSSAVRSQALFLPMVALYSPPTNFYQATGNVTMANLIYILRPMLFTLLAAYALLPVIGVHAAWYAYFFGGISIVAMIWLVAAVKSGHFSFSLDALMMLPKDFGNFIEDTLEFSIHNDKEQVVSASREIHSFCERNGISGRAAYHLSLLAEEMCINAIDHGIRTRKNSFLDIRVIKTADELIYRMRDEGVRFNPVEHLGDTSTKLSGGIGFTLLKELSSSIEYRYTLGMNNLIIHLLDTPATEVAVPLAPSDPPNS